MTTLNAYTVILLRPQYIADSYGRDVYAAHVLAGDVQSAIEIAQQQAFEADQREGVAAITPIVYEICMVFSGHHHPLSYCHDPA